MPHQSATTADRAIGSMIGLAIGDAVGATTEFRKRDTYSPVTDMVGGGHFKLEAGQWTDDTSMALCLLESLLETPTLDEHDLMQRFLAWIRDGHNTSTGRCFGIGQTTFAATMAYRRSGALNSVAQNPKKDAGNGSIMRLAPVAVRWWRDEVRAEEIARRQGSTTHNVPEAIDSCALLCRIIISGIRSGDKATVLATRDDPDWQTAVRDIGQGGWRGKSREAIYSSGYVVQTLEAALWCVDQSDTFEDAILIAANLGHDADTVAAVAGQIAGAVYGMSAMPDAWIERLYESARIRDLTTALYRAGEDPAK